MLIKGIILLVFVGIGEGVNFGILVGKFIISC